MKERRARMEVRWEDMRFWCCPWWISTLLMKTAEWIGMRFRCCWRLIPKMLRVRCWTVTVGLWIITMIWVFFCKALISYPHSVHIYIYMHVVAIAAVTGEERDPRQGGPATWPIRGFWPFSVWDCVFAALLSPFPFGILFLHFQFGKRKWTRMVHSRVVGLVDHDFLPLHFNYISIFI